MNMGHQDKPKVFQVLAGERYKMVTERIQHVQAPIMETLLEQMKNKAGTNITKDALTMAIEHFVSCKAKTGGK